MGDVGSASLLFPTFFLEHVLQPLPALSALRSAFPCSLLCCGFIAAPLRLNDALMHMQVQPVEADNRHRLHTSMPSFIQPLTHIYPQVLNWLMCLNITTQLMPVYLHDYSNFNMEY